MINQQHPITPPPELVRQWVAEIWHEGTPVQVAASDLHIAAKAAQWGADQELEACYYWIENYYGTDAADSLQQGRRPKPPSLKEQALNQLDAIQLDLNRANIYGANTDTIRRALEALPND
jgi:hypothetical protein